MAYCFHAVQKNSYSIGDIAYRWALHRLPTRPAPACACMLDPTNVQLLPWPRPQTPHPSGRNAHPTLPAGTTCIPQRVPQATGTKSTACLATAVHTQAMCLPINGFWGAQILTPPVAPAPAPPARVPAVRRTCRNCCTVQCSQRMANTRSVRPCVTMATVILELNLEQGGEISNDTKRLVLGSSWSSGRWPQRCWS